jgi:hypothetical protein
MSDNTTEQQLAKIIEQNAKILANQKSLEGLILLTANYLQPKEGSRPALFESLANSWPVKQ